MSATTNKDIEEKVNELDKKVDSLGQRQDEVLIPGIANIQKQIEKFAFVSQKDYAASEEARNKKDIKMEERVKSLEDMVYAGGVKNANAINTGVGKAIITIIVAGIVFFIGYSIYKAPPFGGL